MNMGIAEPWTHETLSGFSYQCTMPLSQLQLMKKISIYCTCVTTKPTAATAHFIKGIVCMGMYLYTSIDRRICRKECMSTSEGLLGFGLWHCQGFWPPSEEGWMVTSVSWRIGLSWVKSQRKWTAPERAGKTKNNQPRIPWNYIHLGQFCSSWCMSWASHTVVLNHCIK